MRPADIDIIPWFHPLLSNPHLGCSFKVQQHIVSEGHVSIQAACLARCNGASVELHRGGSFSLQEFRAAVRDTSVSETEHLIASYSRKEFLQTGETSTEALRVRTGVSVEDVCHDNIPAVPAAELLTASYC